MKFLDRFVVERYAVCLSQPLSAKADVVSPAMRTRREGADIKIIAGHLLFLLISCDFIEIVDLLLPLVLAQTAINFMVVAFERFRMARRNRANLYRELSRLIDSV